MMFAVERLPEAVQNEFQRLFWDIEPKGLDTQLHMDFILGRVLSFGSERAVKAIVEEVSLEALREFVLRAPHRLDRRSRRFFEVVFSVQESTCTTKPSRPVISPLYWL
jgi:hypothetical protein